MTTALICIGIYFIVGLILTIVSFKIKKEDIYVKDIFDIILMSFFWPINLLFSLDAGFQILCEKLSKFWNKIKDKKIG